MGLLAFQPFRLMIALSRRALGDVESIMRSMLDRSFVVFELK